MTGDYSQTLHSRMPSLRETGNIYAQVARKVVKQVAPRGHVLRAQLRDLLIGGTVRSTAFALRGAARSYTGKYHTAWLRALDGLRALGYQVELIPGPHGGTGPSAASWRITNGWTA